jgi:hypothetical protein
MFVVCEILRRDRDVKPLNLLNNCEIFHYICKSDQGYELLLFRHDALLSELLAVIHFEWTVRRVIIVIGTSPNVVVRAKLAKCHGLDKYKNVMKHAIAI